MRSVHKPYPALSSFAVICPAVVPTNTTGTPDPIPKKSKPEAIRVLRSSSSLRQSQGLQSLTACIRAGVYNAAIDENTRREERYNLDHQIALAEIEHLAAREDEIDVQGALSFSECMLSNAARLWVESDLSGKRRLQ